MKKYVVIENMTCKGCENRVKTALEKLDFVRMAEVDHVKGCAIVKMPVEVPDEIIKETIEGQGYEVKSIERLLCGCKNIREVDVKKLIESGIDTPEAIIEKTGLGSYGCCSTEIVPLLIEKYKNKKDIDIQKAVFEINKRNDYIIAANDAKKQLKAVSEGADTKSDTSSDCGCH